MPGDTNQTRDIFVHDLETDKTTRVSIASDGAQANADSGFPSISADGRFVAFESIAANLVAEDTNETSDIFIHDRDTGTTRRVSVSSDGAQAEPAIYTDDLPYGPHTLVLGSRSPSISGDGRKIAFTSYSRNLVPNDGNDTSDIFVHDCGTGKTIRVSIASDGSEAKIPPGYLTDPYHRPFLHGSDNPSISADGLVVGFESWAFNLVPDDTSAWIDVFVHDLHTQRTARVSVSGEGIQGDGYSYNPSVSSNGRTIAFTSSASNLVPGDTNGMSDVFVHDRDAGTTARISVASDGTQAEGPYGGNGGSLSPSISADGRFVAFCSYATNLVPGDTNEIYDVFLHDRDLRTTIRVSVASDGSQGKGGSYSPSLSAR